MRPNIAPDILYLGLLTFQRNTMQQENKTISISVLDAPTGAGKTNAIFNWMRNNPSKKYLYVSPMLTEVEQRVPIELGDLEFVYPTLDYDKEKGKASKSFSLLKNIQNGRNVAFSHVLFTQMTHEHLAAIKEKEYTLIIDEEMSFVEAYRGRYSKEDIVSLEAREFIKIHEDDLGRVEWLWHDILENTAYAELKRLCEMQQLFCAKRHRSMLVTHLPVELLSSTKENILLTYMFDGSLMHSFTQLKGVEIKDFMKQYPEVCLLKTEEEFKEEARRLITIGDTPSTIKVKQQGGLSTAWYESTAKKEQLALVASAIRSIVNKHGQSNMLFTMPLNNSERYIKDSRRSNPRCALHRSTKTGEGYFLYTSARATNDYSDKDVMVNAYNRFINVATKAYLQDYNQIIDDDKFALSEMVQWFWRSAIRKGNPVTFYFLSERMERLFTTWLYE